MRVLSAIKLVNALEQQGAKGKAGQIAESLIRPHLVNLACGPGGTMPQGNGMARS